MTMCGVPVVFNKNGPFNSHYFYKENSKRVEKKNLIYAAEDLLANHDQAACRQIAIENYSLEKSFEKSFKD
jgi:hypothetical protein